jgi:O-acetyl-ADP-ribose deacetylase (regulator of RNase III)
MIAMNVEGTHITLARGDVTKQRVDAIVNAANARLARGGGVCGAIYAAGGPALEEETDRIRAKRGGCPTGSAAITGGGNLPARWVVHAVGPVWRGGGGNEDGLLASCHRESLRLAANAGARSIAFPAISTGIYGFPVERAAPIALRAAAAHAREGSAIEEIRFVLFSEEDHAVFERALAELAPQEEEG